MAKTRKGKGKGGGRKRKPCELGDLCPYKHEGQHRGEYSHPGEPDHPDTAKPAAKKPAGRGRRLGGTTAGGGGRTLGRGGPAERHGTLAGECAAGEAADGALDLTQLRARYPRHATATCQALAQSDLEAVNYELVCQCVAALLSTPQAALLALALPEAPEG